MMRVEVLTHTIEPLKTCAVGMKSTRSKEPAHILWDLYDWHTSCRIKEPMCNMCEKHDVCCVRMVRSAVEQGHYGVLEHATFTVSVGGISRACTHQLIRHRLFSFLQTSSRSIDFTTVPPGAFIVPPTLKDNLDFKEHIKLSLVIYMGIRNSGVPLEDARFVLPQATPQNILITGNARQWMHFFALRLDEAAQWEIWQLARSTRHVLRKVAPVLFEKAGEIYV